MWLKVLDNKLKVSIALMVFMISFVLAQPTCPNSLQSLQQKNTHPIASNSYNNGWFAENATFATKNEVDFADQISKSDVNSKTYYDEFINELTESDEAKKLKDFDEVFAYINNLVFSTYSNLPIPSLSHPLGYKYSSNPLLFILYSSLKLDYI